MAKTVLRPSLEIERGYANRRYPLILLERDTGLEPATFALARRLRQHLWCSFVNVFHTLARSPGDCSPPQIPYYTSKTVLKTVLAKRSSFHRIEW